MPQSNKLSREDRETITKGEMLRSLVESDGWKVAKEMLDEQIDVVKLVTTIDFSMTVDEIGKEAYARASAVKLIQDWFNRIQGQIDLYYEQTNPVEEETDGIIVEL